MRLFKVLLKKAFRDILRNIKQFIAIIFIIGISTTLYCGLEANALSFKNRVDLVYSQDYGNIADLWVTINPSVEEMLNTESLNNELLEIKDIAGENGNVERRLMVPSVLRGISSFGLISYRKPNINKNYSTETNSTLAKDSDTNFFYVDKIFKEKYDETSGNKRKLTIGDEVTLTFDTSLLSSVKDIVLNEENFDVIFNLVLSELIKSETIDQVTLKHILENKDKIFEGISSLINAIFENNQSIETKCKITGFMDHPENIQSGEFNSSYYMLGTKTLMASLVSSLGDSLNKEDLKQFINDKIEDSALKEVLLTFLLEYGEDIEKYSATIVRLLNYSLLNEENGEYEDIFQSLFNQYIIKLDQSISIKDAETKINNYFAKKHQNNINNDSTLLAVLNRENYPSCAVIESDIIQANQMAITFPIIFFAVSILVVLTTITQMILKERTQIGTLKGLGLSKFKILFYYTGIFSSVVFIGISLGLIIGPLLIPFVMNIKYGLLYTIPSLIYVFPLISSVITILGFLFITSLLTFLIIFKELQLTPSDSMRPASPKMKFKQRKSITKNTSLMMALRNIRVHIAKSIMVIVGVMGCTGLLISGMGIEDTLNSGVNIDINNILGADFSATYSQNPKAGFMKEKILQIEGIESVYEFASLQITASSNNKNSNEMLYYFDSDTINFKYTYWEPTTIINGETIYNVGLSQSIADELNLKEGDEIKVNYNNKKYSFNISKVFFTFAARGVFVYTDTINLVSYRNSNWINVEKNDDGTLKYDQEEIKEQILEIDGIVTVTSLDDNLARIESYMSSIRYMTNTIKAFAILLAVIVLVNLAILNYQERLREIATLKVLGFSRKEIASSLVYEAMILTTIGAILGLCIGFPLEFMILITNQTRLVAWNYVIYPYTYLIAFLISFITALVVNILISNRINKVSMSESLKSVE